MKSLRNTESEVGTPSWLKSELAATVKFLKENNVNVFDVFMIGNRSHARLSWPQSILSKPIHWPSLSAKMYTQSADRLNQNQHFDVGCLRDTPRNPCGWSLPPKLSLFFTGRWRSSEKKSRITSCFSFRGSWQYGVVHRSFPGTFHEVPEEPPIYRHRCRPGRPPAYPWVVRNEEE